MRVLSDDSATGTWLLDQQPYQKGEYRYEVRGEAVTIREVGGSVATSEIAKGRFDDFIDETTGLPYTSIGDLIADLNNFLFI